MDNVQINDGAYENAVIGVGSAMHDKTEYNRVGVNLFLSFDEIGRIYSQDGIGARIVKAVSDSALSYGWEFDGDDDYRKHALFDSFVSKNKMLEISRDARRTGGALVYMQIADGIADISQPAGNGPVAGVTVYSAGVVNDIHFGIDGITPEQYVVRNFAGTQITLHASRCVVVHGEKLPDEISATANKVRQFFGIGIYDSMFRMLSNYGISITELCNLLAESNITVTSIKGLMTLLSQNPKGALDILTARFTAGKLSKSILKTVVQDADDSTTIKSPSFAGLSDIVKSIMMALSASCGLSMSKIFGEAASGLSATGEGDRRNDNDVVRMWQELVLNDAIRDIYAQIALRNLKSSEPVTVTFAPIDSPTLSELSDIRLKQVQTLRQLWEMEVVTSDEIRGMISGGFPNDINIGTK
jgi:hypothetical protein